MTAMRMRPFAAALVGLLVWFYGAPVRAADHDTPGARGNTSILVPRVQLEMR